MLRPSEDHRGPGFSNLASSIFPDLKRVFKADHEHQVFIFPATGTGAWESGLSNTLSPGDKVVAFRYGQFSLLWVDQAQRLGLDVQIVDAEWGDGADEDKLAQILAADKDKKIKGIMVVHNETTTGVTSDIGKIRRTMNAAGSDALLYVDCVSSLTACDFRMAEWGVDVAMTGSQKGLSLPAGLGIVCASPRALARAKTSSLPRVFFSWADQISSNLSGNFPYTPSVPLLYGLREALDIIMELGLDNKIEHHARLAEATRIATAAWGLKNICSNPRWYSNSVTTIEVPKGIDSNHVIQAAYANHNLSLGLGLNKLNGRCFRIGHLGDMNEVSLLGAIAGTEMALLDAGVPGVKPGSGTGAAVEYLQRTQAEKAKQANKAQIVQ